MEYTTNDISITFWRPIFSQVLSPENLCLCKSTIIVTSSSLSLVPQLESPIRIQKYVPLYNWTDLDDTGIIQISNLCFYLILNLLGGAYWGCALKISEWIIPHWFWTHMNHLKSIHFPEHSFSLISRIFPEHVNINARKIFKISKKSLAIRKFCVLLCKAFLFIGLLYTWKSNFYQQNWFF